MPVSQTTNTNSDAIDETPVAGTEYDPLIPKKRTTETYAEGSATEPTEIYIKSTTLPEWTHLHTIWAIIIRIIGEILTKNTVVFYENFQQQLGLSITQFSYVIVANQLGSIGAMITMPFITKWIPNFRDRISIFGFLCGASGIAFVFSTFITQNSSIVLVWSFIDRLIFGITYFIYITSILDLASQINDNNSGKQGRVIALLEVSWTIASLFYIAVGYSIEYISWDFNFMFFGSMLCLASIASHFIFRKFTCVNVTDIPEQQLLKLWLDNMRVVICRKISILIFFGSFSMGIFTSSFTVIVSSLWFEDVFDLNSFHVGLIALTIFVGELCASLSVSGFVDNCGVWKCAWVSFSTLLIVSLIILILTTIFGPSIGGLAVAISMVFILYFGWESFFIVHQILCIQNTPSNSLTSLMILSNFVFICSGNMIGSTLSPLLWNHGDGMIIIITIWLICLFITVVLYSAVYFSKK